MANESDDDEREREFERSQKAEFSEFLQNTFELDKRVKEWSAEKDAETKAIVNGCPDVYMPPTGLLGELAKYVYSTAARQIPEMALATAIAIMAGICGRTYQAPGKKGLNHSVLLVAGTGTGKGVINTVYPTLRRTVDEYAIEQAMIRKAVRGYGKFSDYVGPEARSAIALHKALIENPSLVCFNDEFGSVLEDMITSRPGTNGAENYDFYMKIFSASGNGELSALAYANKDNNLPPIYAPSLSWIGTTTIERYRSIIKPKAMEDGFIPRLTTIEYETNAVLEDNPNAGCPPPLILIDGLARLCDYGFLVREASPFMPHPILFDADSADKYRELQMKLNAEMNANGEIHRQVYSRLMEKAQKLAALNAVGDDFYSPIIRMHNLKWAYDLNKYDSDKLWASINSGQVGDEDSDVTRRNAVVRIIKNWLLKKKDPKALASLNRREAELLTYYMFPERLLTQATSRNNAFIRYRNGGQAKAIQNTITVLEREGLIKTIMNYKYPSDGYFSKAFVYKVVNPSLFDK